MKRQAKLLTIFTFMAIMVTACSQSGGGGGSSSPAPVVPATPTPVPTPTALFTTDDIAGQYQTDCFSVDGYYTKEYLTLTKVQNDSTNTKMTAELTIQKYASAGCLAASNSELISIAADSNITLGQRVDGQPWHQIDLQIQSIIASVADAQTVQQFNITSECGYNDWSFNAKTITGKNCVDLGGQQYTQNEVIYDILSRDADDGSLTMGDDSTSKTTPGNRPNQLSRTVFKVRKL